MTAIITDDFKKLVLKDLFNTIQDSITSGQEGETKPYQYFIGVGKPTIWQNPTALDDDAPNPINTDREIRNAKLNTVAIKKLENISYVVKRFDWSKGQVYLPYNDNITEEDNYKYYVITDALEVFVCLETGKDVNGDIIPSQFKPDFNDTYEPFRLDDGYVWKFLFTVGALEANRYLGANYFPVRVITPEEGTDQQSPGYVLKQWEVQQNAVPGQILGFEVDPGNEGDNYTDAVTLTIVGDGDVEALATPILEFDPLDTLRENGKIIGAQIVTDDTDPNELIMSFGAGYTYASVVVNHNNPNRDPAAKDAVIRPIIGPKDGLGANSIDDLDAMALMFQVRADGDQEANWFIDNDFRQVTLLRFDTPVVTIDPNNPEQTSLTEVLKSVRVRLTGEQLPFTPDSKITGNVSNTSAYIVKVIDDLVYYIQDETTGFGTFALNEDITEDDGNGQGTIDEIIDAPLNIMDAEVLYIDNRYPVMRTVNQEEDFKIIVKI